MIPRTRLRLYLGKLGKSAQKYTVNLKLTRWSGTGRKNVVMICTTTMRFGTDRNSLYLQYKIENSNSMSSWIRLMSVYSLLFHIGGLTPSSFLTI